MSLSNETIDFLESSLSSRITRRRFIAASTLGAVAARPSVAAGGAYRVGVGVSTSGYQGANRAIEASAEWPLLNVRGKVAVIKPNLVSAVTAQSGAVTDPEVVRAVVDRLLADGAAFILIIESGVGGAYFTACGYDFFKTYDTNNRIRLVDLQTLENPLVPVPGGIYSAIYSPAAVLRRDFRFINIAKLKTHAETLVTLTTKNVFGIPAIDRYPSPTSTVGRFGMHDRGLNQAIIDVNILRPTDFALIDGIVGMEGLGPFSGTPVSMNTVLAGRNAVAVDRVALAAMNVSQASVRHLSYAAYAGLGPSSLDGITVAGDTLPVRTFQLPLIPPSFDPPFVSPGRFNPGVGQLTFLAIRYATACVRLVRILRLFDDRTEMQLIRTVATHSYRTPGIELLSWNGRTEGGAVASPGRYAVHVSAWEPTFSRRSADSLSWVEVAA